VRGFALACAFAASAARGSAQLPSVLLVADTTAISAGSREERRLIDLQARARGIQIGVRPFGPLMLDQMLSADTAPRPRAVLRRSPAWTATWFNSARAYNENTGPVWIGRGLTAAASAGVVGRWLVFSYSMRPVAFWTQNGDYNPSRTIRQRLNDFNNPWFTRSMDEPYRYGPEGHSRIDWGESYVRLDTRWIAAGFSTAAQVWGPARFHPLTLSSNAGGFPHVFLETGTPQSIWIGKVHSRWMAGRLDASGYGPPHGRGARMGIGLIGTLSPRGMSGFEIGASRFFHLYDSPVARDWTSLTLPFGGLLKKGLGNVDVRDAREYNQIAGLFFRVAPTQSSAELYGEFYRDDHAWDVRDIIGEPDHKASYLLGVRRRWTTDAARSTTATMEVVNSRSSHIIRVRAQTPPYQHLNISEGHTLRGLPLGSPIMPGGGGLTFDIERRFAHGAWGFLAEIARLAQNGEGGSKNGEMTGYYTLGARREFQARGTAWWTELRLQPGYGDVRGTNVAVAIRAQR
jgi:hypothetical protein